MIPSLAAPGVWHVLVAVPPPLVVKVAALVLYWLVCPATFLFIIDLSHSGLNMTRAALSET